MDDALLRADCTRCAALCCISLAFDRSDFFAFDKAAGVPCLNLASDNQCRIHAQLKEQGFAGCVRFDCLGAGHRVTQELFGGRSWKDDPSIAEPMFDAFRAMCLVHELLQLLHTADQLPLTPEQIQGRVDLQRSLEPIEGWTLQALTAFERGDVPSEIRAFLATLRDHVSDKVTIAAGCERA